MTDADPFTMEAKLCDDDGIVRGGPMHHGTDYPCTGSAHYAGEHIRCIGPTHFGGLPGDLTRLIRRGWLSEIDLVEVDFSGDKRTTLLRARIDGDSSEVLEA